MFRDALKSILKTVHDQDGLAVTMDQTRDTEILDRLTRRLVLLDNLDPDVPAQLIEDGIKFTISKTQENLKLSRVFKASFDPN